MEQEVLVALIADRVDNHGWKIEKVPKGLRTKVTDKIKKYKEPKKK